jgi:hypothetical protein
MRRSFGRAAIAALTLLLPSFIALSSPAQASQEPGKEPAHPTELNATDHKVLAGEESARRVTELATAKGALGVYFDQARATFVVVTPASGAGSQLASADFAGTGVAVDVVASKIDAATVHAVTETVKSRTWHPDAGKFAYGFYFDAAKSAVALETDAPPGVVQPLLDRFTGAIAYRPGASDRDTRQSDPPPFWGGASITNGSAVCSSGFVVQNGSGTRFMVTAAHCFALGAAVRSTGGGFAMGTVVSRGPFPTWDLELIGGASYGSFIYRGDATGFGSHVIGAGDPVIGFTGYCRSGQTTFENCGQTVTSLTAEFCDASGCTPGLIAYSGGGLSAGGDSGAPFFLPGSTGEFIRGVHIARSGSTMYAERWNTVAAHFGVSIVT